MDKLQRDEHGHRDQGGRNDLGKQCMEEEPGERTGILGKVADRPDIHSPFQKHGYDRHVGDSIHVCAELIRTKDAGREQHKDKP